MNNSIDNPHKIRCLPPMEGDKFGFPFDTWLLPEGPEDEKNFIKLCDMAGVDFTVADVYNRQLYYAFSADHKREKVNLPEFSSEARADLIAASRHEQQFMYIGANKKQQ